MPPSYSSADSLVLLTLQEETGHELALPRFLNQNYIRKCICMGRVPSKKKTKIVINPVRFFTFFKKILAATVICIFGNGKEVDLRAK